MKKKIFLIIFWLVFIVLIFYLNGMRILYRDTIVSSFDVYFESWENESVAQLIYFDKKGNVIKRDIYKILIDKIKDAYQSCRIRYLYYVKEFNSYHKCYEIQKFWENHKKELVKYNKKTDFLYPKLFLVINYIDNKSDTLSLSSFSIKHNGKNYELNDNFVRQMTKYLPKYHRNYVRYVFGLRKKAPKRNKFITTLKKFRSSSKMFFNKFW